MIGTIMIHGSNGEVMAPLGSPGTFYRGKRRTITLVQVNDPDLPSTVRTALEGMKIPVIFTFEGLQSQGVNVELLGLTPGTVLSYLVEVVEALEVANKPEAATELRKMMGSYLDMCTFSAGDYTFAK